MERIKRLNQENRRGFTVIMVIVTLMITVPLTACTSPQNANAKVNAAPDRTASTTQSPKSNRLDACALLSKAEVETILGQTITSADSGRLMEGTANSAATSQCSYKTAAAQIVELFVRRSPVADNTPEAVQKV